MRLRRIVRIREGLSAEIGADVMNLLNNTQLSGAYAGALGATNVAANAAKGLAPGMGGSDTFGTIGTANFNPRQVMLRVVIRF